MKKAARRRPVEFVSMDYTEYLIAKAGLIVLAAFAWGLFCGLTGRSMRPGRRDKHPAKER